ncbi:B12-binding domain-containing radical SAM protein [Magnetofaba australis]|uniref:Putative Fe-S oxidoreductase n=1 Tax=Magnetofaba australis IT-1 TaxID=1434232 RepID=A0A1Y2K4B1_9PROT|nr:radical SAM protein [Magnetofaba australis]OSM04208.1 putative Fe-S oxidoreductase [Magnetofaba australis IT-1]
MNAPIPQKQFIPISAKNPPGQSGGGCSGGNPAPPLNLTLEDHEPLKGLPIPEFAMINVVLDGDYQYEQEIPLGVGYLVSFLRSRGAPVQLQQCIGERDEDIAAAMEVDADLYGFQLNMVNYLKVREVARGIKARRPQAQIILGGPFLSSLAEGIIEGEPCFDAIVIGEGELTLLGIIKAYAEGDLNYARLPGVVFRDAEGRAVKNAPPPLIPDLDLLPPPARDNLETLHRDPGDGGLLGSVRIISSRGCIANCTFCSVNFYTKLQKGKIWRGHSAKHMVDELETLNKEYGAKIFNFSDSSFEDPGNKGKRRTREMCNDIIDRGLELSIKVYMRGDTMLADDDDELLRLWKQAGVDVVIVGVEAGSDHELDYYGKRASVQQNIDTIRRLQKLDLFYIVMGYLMFGPNSTLETLRTNIDLLKELDIVDNPNQVSNVLMLVQDSALYDTLRQEGRVIEPENCWELPKYTFLDPRAERAAKHWDGLFGKFPATLQVNNNQINFENLISRMKNPMNAAMRERIGDWFDARTAEYLDIKKQFGTLQHAYFHRVLDAIERDCADSELEEMAQGYFGDVYDEYLPKYRDLYEGAVSKMEETGLGLSGLMFRNFYSHAVNKGIKRT